MCYTFQDYTNLDIHNISKITYPLIFFKFLFQSHIWQNRWC